MRLFLVVALLITMAMPVRAVDMTAPMVSGEAETLMPNEMPSFGEGLLYILKTAINVIRPDFGNSYRLCVSVIAIAMLVSVMNVFSGRVSELISMAGVLGTGVLLLGTANTLIHTASETVQEISSYGKLLLPVMTAAVATQGGTASSMVLYTGTAFFDSLLGTIISALVVPLIYLFLALVIGHCAIGEKILKQLQDFLKWLITWCMKSVLYIFTGYMSISSVIAGGTDKAALKAAKLTISSAVPVVGGIMSDASETILLGAAVVKNSVGTYGLLSVIAILILPFLRVGVLYLLFKVTGAICGVFVTEKISDLLKGFSTAMGFLLGLTGTVSLLFFISIVCCLKGLG